MNICFLTKKVRISMGEKVERIKKIIVLIVDVILISCLLPIEVNESLRFTAIVLSSLIIMVIILTSVITRKTYVPLDEDINVSVEVEEYDDLKEKQTKKTKKTKETKDDFFMNAAGMAQQEAVTMETEIEKSIKEAVAEIFIEDEETAGIKKSENDEDAEKDDAESGQSEKDDEKSGNAKIDDEKSDNAEKYDDSEALQKEKPVISIVDVCMNYKIATSNASGIKDYLIQRLKKQMTYRELKALNHVSFDVFKGEIVGIIGTNGSGKSTLLKIVSGALRPTSGHVDINHKKVQLLTLGTGFDMELTAKENVYLNGAIIGYTKEFIDSHYDEIVAFAELEGFMDEKVKNFSSGMVSRLGFAIATVGDAAEILILDEVLSVGDEFFRKKSLKRVKEMIHGGSTVLMVSHGMGTIEDNCTKAVWIEKGELRMVGEPKEVCTAYSRMNEECG